jgi:hypothetical protein
MKKGALEEQILRASKEVIVKFIEAGRLSPSGFGETFRSIYRSIDETVKETRDSDWGDADSGPQSES